MRTDALIVLVGCVLVVAATSGAGAADAQASLLLRRHAVVEGDVIRVRDVFDNPGSAANTVIANGPAPGGRAIFDAEWLSRTAQRLNLSWRPSSRLDRVEVVRSSTVVTGAMIEDAIRQRLTLQGYGDAYDLVLGNPLVTIQIPANQPPSVAVVQLTFDRHSDRLVATVAAPAGDPGARQLQIVGRLISVASVPVPTHDLARGEVIGEADIEWLRLPRAKLGGDVVTTADRIIGLQSRRILRARTPVRSTNLQPPLLVSKGDQVTLVFATSSMRLTAMGRALDSGSRSEVIRVLNTQSNNTVEARIDGPRLVSVGAAHVLATN